MYEAFCAAFDLEGRVWYRVLEAAPFAGKAVLEIGARLVGVYSRNLKSLSMNGDDFEEMVPLIAKDRLIVAESGIKTAEDVARLKALGVHAMLVGESFSGQVDLEKVTKTLAEAGR